MNLIWKSLLLLFLISIFSFCFKDSVLAVYDPFSVPNNKFGIHILFPSELEDAGELVNSNGGDWGYVTIPIQHSDKDLRKWQDFMNTAKKFHLIPLIRLSTNGDYFNNAIWEKPKNSDVLDFANFLNSLDWPTKNRYIIVYNEVNRADEWGGMVNPSEYAQILSYAVTSFKSTNENFFIISAGLDNAAPNQGNKYMNQYLFMRQMNSAIPGIFNQIDGLASHSYPNPNFSQAPASKTAMSVVSFRQEKQLAESLSSKKFPVFITETGWSSDALSDSLIASYYQSIFANAWLDPSIVAVTPFILKAGAGPFQKFSMFDTNGNPNFRYKAISSIAKTKGSPIFSSKKVLGNSLPPKKYPMKKFKGKIKEKNTTTVSTTKTVLKWFLRI
ncbi:hypothetical protein KKG52_00210 [Patescibacteria group bacterium]|nr:hypothetical protein [Patescibacteria group bacterium]